MTDPRLTSFDLSLSPPEQLTLNFDSNVDPSTCNVELLTLQNSTTFAEEASLIPNSNGTCVAGSTQNSINVMLADTDWFMLQGNIYLATSRSNTYLSALPGFVQDSNGVGSDGVSALQVRNFTAGTNPPTLLTGGLDFSMGSLGLIFNKAIVLNTINPNGITLNFMNTTSNTVGSLTLSGAEQFGYFDLGSQIFIVLVRSEFFPLKLTSMDPYRVSITAGTFTGIFGVSNMAQDNVDLFNVAPDFDPPMPTGFSLDMNMGILSVTFQEPLATESGDYDLSAVYLTGAPNLNANTAYNLSSSAITSTEFYSSRLTITLSANDLNAIKIDPDVCTSISNCFLIANDTSFVDTEGNLAISTVTPATTFIIDVTAPELVAFSIDLNVGLLTLTFTEPLDTTSIDFSQIRMYGPGGSGTPINFVGNGVPGLVIGGANII